MHRRLLLLHFALPLALAGCPRPAEPPAAPAPVAAAPVPPAPAAQPASAQAVATPAPPTPAAGGSGKLHTLPQDLPVDEYSGEGVMIDIFAAAATPRAGRGDPAEVAFTMVIQRAKGDFDLVHWKSRLDASQSAKASTAVARLEVTPRVKPVQLGVMENDGAVPSVHLGWLDILLKDPAGRPLGRLAISDEGWASLAPRDQQPAGCVAKTLREGNAAKCFFDFKALSDGAALLRLESRETGSAELTVKSADGAPHQLVYPHAALRLLGPDQFQTSAELSRENYHPRDHSR